MRTRVAVLVAGVFFSASLVANPAVTNIIGLPFNSSLPVEAMQTDGAGNLIAANGGVVVKTTQAGAVVFSRALPGASFSYIALAVDGNGDVYAAADLAGGTGQLNVWKLSGADGTILYSASLGSDTYVHCGAESIGQRNSYRIAGQHQRPNRALAGGRKRNA